MNKDLRKNIFEDPKEYKRTYRCEYLVVGTGPGGSVAGEALTRAGKDVIFLEEGGYLPFAMLSITYSKALAESLFCFALVFWSLWS